MPHYAVHCIKIQIRAQERNAYLHGEERLVGVTRVSLEETREKVEVGARGVDPIELTCSRWMEQ
jgi:hypothetical protein